MSEQTRPAAQSTSPRTLVLALGNPLRGDDGVGVAILERLRQGPLPDDVTLLDGGTAGLETALLLQDCERAIILDAAMMGRPPGNWVRFVPDAAQWQTSDLRGTLHNAGLAEALALGDALGILPPDILIYGVQPEIIGWEAGLSDPVRAAIPAVCDSVLTDLRCA